MPWKSKVAKGVEIGIWMHDNGSKMLKSPMKVDSWWVLIAGDSGSTGLQQRILNVVLFVALVIGLLFLVSDSLLTRQFGYLLLDLAIVGIFGLLFWLARFRAKYKLVAHLGTWAGLIFFVSNFFVFAGVQGPTLTVFLMILIFSTILHSQRTGLAYVALGSALVGACLIGQAVHPEWVTPYGAPQIQYWDAWISFLFCAVFSFFILQMVMRFFRENLERTRQAQTAAAQVEKMAALGELLASVSHYINTPIGVISSSLSMTRSWWHDVMPRTPQILAALSPGQAAAFWQLFEHGPMLSALAVDSKTQRSQRKVLEAELQALPLPDAEDLASELVELGFLHWDSRWQPLTEDPAGRAAFSYVLSIFMLQRTNRMQLEAIDKINKLVETLGAYARSGKPEDPPSLTKVSEGLDTVLNLYAQANKHTLEVVRDYQECPLVLARPDQLIQVWTNLVQNALQAMNHEGTLTLSLRHQEEWVVVTVSDTGPGIPPELQKKIFQTFFTTKERGTGTGLGLAIVKRIVEEHDGFVEVGKAPGGGAQFVVRLPSVQTRSNA